MPDAEPIRSTLEVDLSKSKAAIAQVKAARTQEERKADTLASRVRVLTRRLQVAEQRAQQLRAQVMAQLRTVAQQFAVIGVTEIAANATSELPGVAGSVIGIGVSAAFGAATLGPVGAVIGALSATVSAIFSVVKSQDQQLKAMAQKIEQLEARGKQFEEQLAEERRRRGEERRELVERLEKQAEEKAAELDYQTWQMLP